MTAEEAIEKYTEKFGGFPLFLFLGAPDEYIVSEVKMALRTGREIEPDEEGVDY